MPLLPRAARRRIQAFVLAHRTIHKGDCPVGDEPVTGILRSARCYATAFGTLHPDSLALLDLLETPHECSARARAAADAARLALVTGAPFGQRPHEYARYLESIRKRRGVHPLARDAARILRAAPASTLGDPIANAPRAWSSALEVLSALLDDLEAQSKQGAPHQEPLRGTRKILNALPVASRPKWKTLIRLNDRFNGPIKRLSAGRLPFVGMAALLKWWGELAEKGRESEDVPQEEPEKPAPPRGRDGGRRQPGRIAYVDELEEGARVLIRRPPGPAVGSKKRTRP